MRIVLLIAAIFFSQSAMAASPWVSWNPVFGSTSGSGLAVNQSFNYQRTAGATQLIQMAFSVDELGTASGGLTVTLPSISLRGATFSCMVYNLKKNCNATTTINSTIMTIYLYDGTFPIKANHQEIILEGFYEITPP